MRRTIEVRRGDVMHYTWRESKAVDRLNLRFFGLELLTADGRKAALTRILARKDGVCCARKSARRPSRRYGSPWPPPDKSPAKPAKTGAGERNRTAVISLEGCQINLMRQSQLIILDRQNHPKKAFC